MTNLEKIIRVMQQGGSIVDYLNSRGKDSSKEARRKLADKYKVKDYDFSASKNLELLSKLRSSENSKSQTPNSDKLSTWKSYYRDLRSKGFTEMNAVKKADAIMKSQGYIRPSNLKITDLEKNVSQETKGRDNQERDKKSLNGDYQQNKDMKEHIYKGRQEFIKGAGEVYLKSAGALSNMLYYPIAAASGKLTDAQGNPSNFSWKTYGRQILIPGTDNTFADQVLLPQKFRDENPIISGLVATAGDPNTLLQLGTTGAVKSALTNTKTNLKSSIQTARSSGGFGNVTVNQTKVPTVNVWEQGSSRSGSKALFHSSGGKRAPQGINRNTTRTGSHNATKLINQNPAKVISGSGSKPKFVRSEQSTSRYNPIILPGNKPLVLPIWDNDKVVPVVPAAPPIVEKTIGKRMEVLSPNTWGSREFQKAFRDAGNKGLSTFNFNGMPFTVELGQGNPGKRNVIEYNPNIPQGQITNPTNQVVNMVPDSASNINYHGTPTINTLEGGIDPEAPRVIKSLDTLLKYNKGGLLDILL